MYHTNGNKCSILPHANTQPHWRGGLLEIVHLYSTTARLATAREKDGSKNELIDECIAVCGSRNVIVVIAYADNDSKTVLLHLIRGPMTEMASSTNMLNAELEATTRR